MPRVNAEKAQLHEQGLRRCTRCERVLPESEFNKQKKDRYGLFAYCRPCSKNLRAEYYAGHKDRELAQGKAWREQNADHHVALLRKWKQNNRHVHRSHASARRARKADNGVFTVSSRDNRRLTTEPCYHCGAPAEHIDHIVPIARGGNHGIGNLAPMCAACNLSKGSKTYAEFKYGRKS